MTPEQANSLAAKMLIEELTNDAIYTHQIQSVDSFINLLLKDKDDSEPEEREEG